VFQECDYTVQQLRVKNYLLGFTGLGFLLFIARFLQYFSFGYSGEKLTERLRAKTFQTILRQEVAWFDKEENNTGALCTRLATDASAIQHVVTKRLATIVESITNLVIVIIIGFVISWRLTTVLVVLNFFMIMIGILQTYLTAQFNNVDKQIFEKAGTVSFVVRLSVQL
ncbi:unnamed protein product, partial [Didymodactylos carnosus]